MGATRNRLTLQEGRFELHLFLRCVVFGFLLFGFLLNNQKGVGFLACVVHLSGRLARRHRVFHGSHSVWILQW